MDFIPIQRFFVKLMQLSEHKSGSAKMKMVHNALLFIWRTVMITGVLLNDISLFTVTTPEDKARIPFLAFSTSKILAKGIVFWLQQCEISQMWDRLNDRAFKTKNMSEMK